MKKILLIAGEVSADNHGAALVKEIKKLEKQISVFGIGGDSLAAEGMEILVHLKKMAFLGIGEIIRHLPYIHKVRQMLLDKAAEEKPECAILIDYPGFNLRLAASLKKLNIPVIYYISPQLWAWGKGRVEKIRKYVDCMIVLFPFEKDFYADHGISAVYAGHPIVDHHFKRLPDKPKELDKENAVLGLLPGSRKQEINRLLPEMVRTAELLFERGIIKRAEILKTEHLPEYLYEERIEDTKNFIKITSSPIYEALPRYDAVLTASGTATLEAGYFKVPMVIVYKVNKLTYWLARRLVKIRHIGLVNIVAEKDAAVELIQHEFTAQKAADAAEKLLEPETNIRIRNELGIIAEKLGAPGASARAAEQVIEFLDMMK